MAAAARDGRNVTSTQPTVATASAAPHATDAGHDSPPLDEHYRRVIAELQARG